MRVASVHASHGRVHAPHLHSRTHRHEPAHACHPHAHEEDRRAHRPVGPCTRRMDTYTHPLERAAARHSLAHENHGPSNENLGPLHHGGASANAGLACANEKDAATKVRHSTFPSLELHRCSSDLHRSNPNLLACNPNLGACMFFVHACMSGVRRGDTRSSTREGKPCARARFWWTRPCPAVVGAPAWCIDATPTFARRCRPCAIATRAVARASLTLARHGETCMRD